MSDSGLDVRNKDTNRLAVDPFGSYSLADGVDRFSVLNYLHLVPLVLNQGQGFFPFTMPSF